MTLVRIEPDNGFNPYEIQSHRMSNWLGDGWVELPHDLSEKFFECNGYCSLEIEDGVLKSIVPSDFQPPIYLPTPTIEERLTALELAQLANMGVTPSV